MEDKKFSGLSLTVIALLLVAIVGTGVYAYYASQATGTTSVRALKYSFKVEAGETANVANKTFEITLNPNKIQPGTQIAVPVKVDASESEVNVNYTIGVKYAADSETITNLDFCLTSTPNGACADAKEIGAKDGAYTDVFGTLTLKPSDGEVTKTFYLTWPYGEAGSATQDTADMNKEITLSIEVKGQQANPNAS